MRRLTAGLALLLAGGLAQAAQIALYPTGPAQDSAYLRFVNAGASTLELSAEGGQASLALEPAQPVSAFFPVPGGSPVQGRLQRDGQDSHLQLHVAPGDFATLFALDDGHGGIEQLLLSEPFDIPNQLKASLALFSAEPSCVQPQVLLAGRDLDLFQRAEAGNPRRVEINPRASLTVQLSCAGQASGSPLELGALEAGKRYSLMLLPSPRGPRLLNVTDSVAH